MSSLSNKRILLGVTGGIAAYKSADLVRRLQDAGADVRVVMTPAACEFITPLTMQALSGNPVHTSLLDSEAEAAMGHIELARWGDLLLVAPASADFVARLSNGQGDDLLSTLCLACPAPIAVAPAMNQAMYRSDSTRDNLATLKQRGIHIFGPAEGVQACGDVGPGRVLEPLELVNCAAGLFATGSLAGKKVVITAGPTREPLDPVRYISNYSSGKMGYALAAAAAEAGAETVLISGPVNLPPPERLTTIKVVSAMEMHKAAINAAEGADMFIATAAVADYRPVEMADQKIKKSGDEITLQLTKNPDIVASVAAMEQRPVTIGFAAESENLEQYARGKLERKKLDMVIANDITGDGIGFNSDDNQVALVSPDGIEKLPKLNKQVLARELIARLAQLL
ncbi:bifunctional phosphopantothenoylcysteine decarboxylase/phosphopantothenate--cysteine ligase CoaBC [Porticoccus sp. W117]|uniref:bifunctional phosphopantothenoylcysteine decarboxylase/phosphopantothenate--cysteine ligase CoaBC n=1 Tax=Porticoccus sp. W117 TaxID=3054777 RepID=UPI002591D283|nr:bifunctional phosphopantothenoylcysteine decarboxylase/phosphopantothenate--cysteine ligase CoaBC [Porticoccus sp. W117]MDM3870540.1 bifunctional phosphopantothenoylcysteine decarboxylase/phosphopantothenate--cysteine ligase CoaBC [Porticoccus sp. W117]